MSHARRPSPDGRDADLCRSSNPNIRVTSMPAPRLRSLGPAIVSNSSSQSLRPMVSASEMYSVRPSEHPTLITSDD